MEQHFYRMAREDADVSFLRLFECIMENAPQLMLHLHVIFQKDSINDSLNSNNDSEKGMIKLTIFPFSYLNLFNAN